MNGRHQQDKEALFIAIKTNNKKLLQLTLNNPHISFDEIRCKHHPLTLAAHEKRWSFIRLMLCHPAKKKQRDLDEALFLAVKANKKNTVKALLVAHADPDTPFKTGEYPLTEYASFHCALKNNNPKIAGLLIHYGASFHTSYFITINTNYYGESTRRGDVYDFTEEMHATDCLNKAWEEHQKLKNKSIFEKEVSIIIAQGLRQRESFLLTLPAEIIKKIFQLVNKNFYKKITKICYSLHQISFNLVIQHYHPKFYSNQQSVQLIAKISDGLRDHEVNFHDLYQLVEIYLNQYLTDKNMDLKKAQGKSSLIRLLKKYHIATHPHIHLYKNHP